MKKLCLALITGLALSSTAMAEKADLTGYYSSQHPLTSARGNLPKAKAGAISTTNITIVNASNNSIFIAVPGTPVYDRVDPVSIPDHVLNGYGAYWTTIQMEDYRHVQIPNTPLNVCPRAIVVFYGPYNVVVDDKLCWEAS